MSDEQDSLHAQAMQAWQQQPWGTATSPPHEWVQDYIINYLSRELGRTQQQVSDLFNRNEALAARIVKLEEYRVSTGSSITGLEHRIAKLEGPGFK